MLALRKEWVFVVVIFKKAGVIEWVTEREQTGNTLGNFSDQFSDQN